MNLNQKRKLSHPEARGFVRRAVEKTEDLCQRGAYVAVDEGGVVVSASRMDGTGSFAIPLCRAKAYAAAVNREPSANIYDRTHARFLGIYLGYQGVARDQMFPGQGAIPIEREGLIIGALSTGAGIGPFLKFEGVDPAKFVVDGAPTNLEDLVISYALGGPYMPQHGDDMKRWMDAYGFPPAELAPGRGFEESPPAHAQEILDVAIGLADAAIDEANAEGVSISVAITDRHGDLIQHDRMDGAAPMTPDIAEAVAVTAINFQCASGDVPADDGARRLADIVPFKILAVPGGLPVFEDGNIIGAIGISGSNPEANERIAAVAIGATETRRI